MREATQAETQRAEERGRPFAVILVELTEITQLNTQHGYAVSDEGASAAARAASRESRLASGALPAATAADSSG